MEIGNRLLVDSTDFGRIFLFFSAFAVCMLSAILSSSLQSAAQQQNPSEQVYIVKLYGSSIVGPYPGDPDGHGVAKLVFDLNTQSIFYDVYMEKITEPSRMFIFNGDYTTFPGASCTFANLLTQSGQIKLTSPAYGQYRVQGATPVGYNKIYQVFQFPYSYFLIVFTRQFDANGAIRGQLNNVLRGAAFDYQDYNSASSSPRE